MVIDVLVLYTILYKSDALTFDLSPYFETDSVLLAICSKTNWPYFQYFSYYSYQLY